MTAAGFYLRCPIAMKEVTDKDGKPKMRIYAPHLLLASAATLLLDGNTGLKNTSRTAGVSRSREGWPDLQSRNPT